MSYYQDPNDDPIKTIQDVVFFFVCICLLLFGGLQSAPAYVGEDRGPLVWPSLEGPVYVYLCASSDQHNRRLTKKFVREQGEEIHVKYVRCNRA